MTKTCLLCGHQLFGNNFDSLMCETCKSFFMSNAFNEKDWIHLNRLKSDQQFREEINERKRKYSKITDKKSLPNWDYCDTNCNLFNIYDTINNIDIINEVNTQIQKIDNSIEVNDIIDISDDISEMTYKKVAELDNTPIPIARPIVSQQLIFNELEANKLCELFSATNFFSESENRFTSGTTNYSDMHRIMCSKFDQQVLQIVRMSTTLTSFNGICENDKICLIKYGSLELFCMRAVPFYDYITDHWTYAMDNNNALILSLEVMHEFPHNLYAYYKQFLNKICKEWEYDSVILDLLTAIVLFNPDRPYLLYKDIVKLQQHIYMHLLQRYLFVRYKSINKMRNKFLKLLNALMDLNVLGTAYSKICIENTNKHLELMGVMFDQKDNITNKKNFKC
ncbi:nuclear hormone receptor HR96-like [Oppia nitens]|uniref:nuclear hormone receptor HR96-like n=1 Tax=Oppia nitens TaxID=1686743 RepID=UPI0023DB0C3E|nr:nuclear hormone receptor HR96-like [Oppia nitens]